MVNDFRVLSFHNRSYREKPCIFYRLPQIITNQGEDGQNISEDCRRQTEPGFLWKKHSCVFR